jgi:hypothetical protein
MVYIFGVSDVADVAADGAEDSAIDSPASLSYGGLYDGRHYDAV